MFQTHGQSQLRDKKESNVSMELQAAWCCGTLQGEAMGDKDLAARKARSDV